MRSALLLRLAGAVVMTVAMLTPCAAGAETIGINLATWHDQHHDNGAAYRSTTPGLYMRAESGLTAGIYHNSIGRWSVHAGYSADLELTERVSAGLYVGAVSGYQRHTTRTEWCSAQPGGTDAQPCRDGLYLNWATTSDGGSSKTYLAPLVAPSLRVQLSGAAALRVNLMPKSREKGSSAINLSIEMPL
jgi:hypothetical protein